MCPPFIVSLLWFSLSFNDRNVYDVLIILLVKIHLTASPSHSSFLSLLGSVFLSKEQMHHKKTLIKLKYLCDSTFCLSCGCFSC